MKKLSVVLCLIIAVPLLWSETTYAGPSAIASPTVTPTPGPVEYTLPYPGILPTHPLYMVKLFRDRIIEVLITDSVNKAEFYILQADKKLNMAILLTELKKSKEASIVLEESQMAREQALTLLTSHKKSGGTIPGHVIEKFFLSLEKHGESLRAMSKGVEKLTDLKSTAEKALRAEY